MDSILGAEWRRDCGAGGGREVLRRLHRLWHFIRDAVHKRRGDEEALKVNKVLLMCSGPTSCCRSWSHRVDSGPLQPSPQGQPPHLSVLNPVPSPGQDTKLCRPVGCRDPLHAAALILGSRRGHCWVSMVTWRACLSLYGIVGHPELGDLRQVIELFKFYLSVLIY